MSDFPLIYMKNHNAYDMQYYKPAAAATFKAQVLVVLNTGTGEIDECGVDPALILGIVHSTAAAKFLYDNRVPVAVITSELMVGLSGVGLIATDVGKDYGIAKNGTSGNWQIDRTETVNTRFHIDEVDIANQIAWGKFLAANLQGDAIAS